jgi:predicted transcriptional regulator
VGYAYAAESEYKKEPLVNIQRRGQDRSRVGRIDWAKPTQAADTRRTGNTDGGGSVSTTVNTSLRLPEELKSAMQALTGKNSETVRRAINDLADLQTVVRIGAGAWGGRSVVTSIRLSRRDLRVLDEAARQLGVTRHAMMILALGAYIQGNTIS